MDENKLFTEINEAFKTSNSSELFICKVNKIAERFKIPASEAFINFMEAKLYQHKQGS